MDFNSTVKGSALEGFYPAGWDFEKIDKCVGAPETVCDRQPGWNKDFTPVMCSDLGEFETYMGHEIAMQIKLAADRKQKIAFILPVGPMGMYKWVVYFLREWKISCSHVWTFNMDEWADGEGNTLSPEDHGSFQFPRTGGWSGMTNDFKEIYPVIGDKPVLLMLTSGEHTIEFINDKGGGLNLDRFKLVPATKP